MFNEEDEIIQGFIEESAENLAQVEEDFLALEQNPNALDIERINQAFRCVHSIKGSAGFMGLKKISELAHSMENLMDLIRKGEMTPDQGIISLLLEGVDHLNNMFADPMNSNEYDISATNELLKEVYQSPRKGHQTFENVVPTPAAVAPQSPAQNPAQAASSPFVETKSTPQAPPSAPPRPAPIMEGNSYPERFVMEAITVLHTVDRCLDDLSKNQSQASLIWVNLALESLEDIKAASNLLGYRKIYAISHVLHVLLGLVRSEALRPDQVTTDLFTDGMDLLKTLLQDSKESDAYDIRELHERLVALCARGFFQQFDLDEYQVMTPPSFITSKKTAEEIATSLVEVDESGTEVHTSEPQRMAAKMAPSVAEAADEEQEEGSKEIVAERVIQPRRERVTKETAAKTDLAKDQESIRVKVALLNRLINLTGEMVLVRNQQLQLMINPNPTALKRNTQRLDVVTSELQECVMKTRMQPVGTLFQKFNRIVRDLAQSTGKEITLSISGSDVEIDKSILEALSDPLTHMIRNSCDHGVETPKERLAAGKSEAGQLHLSAWHEGGQVNIELRDDGKGINIKAVRKKAVEKGLKSEQELETMTEREIMQLILLPGFSTAEQVSDLSGRGVGMDVVRSNIEKIGGHLNLESIAGEGTSVRLRLPLTLAIIPCLIVKVDQFHFAIPQVNLVELVTYSNEDVVKRIEIAKGREVCRLRNELLPLLRLNEILNHPENFNEDALSKISIKYRQSYQQRYHEYLEQRKSSSVVAENFRLSVTFAVLRVGGQRYGLIVDEVIGTEEIVVKPMHQYLKSLRIYSGSTVMGDGKVALILDVMGMAKHSGISTDQTRDERLEVKQKIMDDHLQSILLFKYGKEEQFAISLNMVRRIERIEAKEISHVGDREFVTIDRVSYQILRLGNYMKVSEYEEQKRPYLLVPKMIQRPFGILVSSIQDIVETSLTFESSSIKGPGIMGSALVQERLTLFIDYFKLVELADPSAVEFTQQKANDKPKKILLVEDVPFFRTLVTNYLHGGGYDVISAENGQQGLERYREQEFDLIVSDIEMPVMNGFDFAKNIRGHLDDQKIPLLALTGLSSDKDRQKAFEVGFDAYEVKLDRSKLLKRIEDLIINRRPTPGSKQNRLLEQV